MDLRSAALLLAWTAAAAVSARAADAGSWSVGVITSGGFAGRGRGNVLVDSQGKVMTRGADLPGRAGGTCEGTLSAEELRRIGAAVASSKPEAWKDAGTKAAAPDAFGYSLELRQGERSDEAQWHDNTRGRLPPDLAELWAGVEAAWDRIVKSCRSK